MDETALVALAVLVALLALVFAFVVMLIAVGLIPFALQRSGPAPKAKFIPKRELLRRLLKLDNKKNPFRFLAGTGIGYDIEAEWKVIDAKWLEVLGAAWEKKTYQAFFTLDEEKRTVRCAEHITQANFSMGGGGGISGSWGFFQGVQLFRQERGVRYGIKPDFSIGEIYNYKFNPSDVKEVVRQLANDAGWSFELVVSPRLLVQK